MNGDSDNRTSKEEICPDCGDPIGAGSNHTVIGCLEIQVEWYRAQFEAQQPEYLRVRGQRDRLRAALAHAMEQGGNPHHQAVRCFKCEEARELLSGASLAPETTASRDAEIVELRGALLMLYDKWENGAPCYEEPEEQRGYFGHAFNLTEKEESRVLALLPEGCPEPSEKANPDPVSSPST